MRIFPESALVKIEFEQIKTLMGEHCNTEYARAKAGDLHIHTRREFIEWELRQAHEFKLLLQNGQYFPNDHTLNLSRELKLLGIPGATLTGEQFLQIRKLAESMQSIFRWFDPERKIAYPALARVIANTQYEKSIIAKIDEGLDESDIVRDNTSEELANIRLSVLRKRNELRRVFDGIVYTLGISS